jgi:hypothetical protein
MSSRPPSTRHRRESLLCALLLTLAAFSTAPLPARAEQALLLLDPIGVAGTRALVAEIDRAGGRVEHVVPGRALIGRFDDATLPAIASLDGVRAIYPEGSVPEVAADADALDRGIAGAWRQWNALRTGEVDEEAALRVGTPLAGDAAIAPRGEGPGGKALAPPPGANFFDTSEFMLGSVTIVVLCPESDGSIDANQEDWTPAEEANVTAEIMNGMAWWTARAADIGASLSFVYDFRFSIDQGYEPITRPSGNNNLWVGATMTALGYTAFGNHFDNTRDLLNDERDTFGTDWAVAMFVIDDTIDPDNHFTAGFFAFSYYGGPYLWMTYDEDGWGNANMDMISAHELGHSFYALDEYASSGCTCTLSQGYLNGRNQNCDATCSSNIPNCIMRSSTAPIGSNILEFNSAKQVGLLDADSDLIANILDTFPETALDPYGSDTTADWTPTYTGTAVAVPKDNLNTIGQRNDITLNTISLVEFRVDGGSWSAATPGDGSFDSASEAFTFTTGPLANGPHVLEARAAQANGNAEEQSAADTLVVIGSPVSVGTSTIGSADRLSAQPSLSRGAFTFRFGLAAPSRVRVAVYSPEGRAVAHLMDRELAAGPHAIPWDGRPSGGAPAPAGVYFVRLDAPGRSESARIVVVR